MRSARSFARRFVVLGFAPACLASEFAHASSRTPGFQAADTVEVTRF